MDNTEHGRSPLRGSGYSAEPGPISVVPAVPVSIPNAEVRPRPNFAEFSQALLIAAGIYSDVELAFWLTAPQPLLEMRTPVQLLARGEGQKLLQVMQQLEDGVYV